jgi:hypothetical protein
MVHHRGLILMAIPKIVHFCWFGSEKPDPHMSYEKSRATLQKMGYDVKLWTEDNYDFSESEAARNAFISRKWSLLSNYARVDLLNKFGGIYLDTDIEVVKDFDDLLSEDFVIGFMWDCCLGTAVIASSPGHPVVGDILSMYKSTPASLISPNNNTLTDYFLTSVSGFKLNGKTQRLGSLLVLEKHAFEQPSLFRRHNITVHHFTQTWKNNSTIKRFLKNIVINSMSLWLYRKYICWNSKRISPYYPVYLAHKAART